MRLSISTILAIVIAAGISFTAYVMGQGHAPLTTAPTGVGQSLPGQALSGQNAQGQIGQTAQGINTTKPTMSASPEGSMTPTNPDQSTHMGSTQKTSKPTMSASPEGSMTPTNPDQSTRMGSAQSSKTNTTNADTTPVPIPSVGEPIRPRASPKITAPPSQSPGQ